MLLRELVETVIVAAGVERIGDQHRVFDRRDGDAAAAEHGQIVFHVLRDLEHARVFEQRLQTRDGVMHRDLPGDELRAAEEIVGAGAMPKRNVTGASARQRQRDADEMAGHRIERRRLGVERDETGGVSVGDPSVELLEALHGLIAAAVDRASPAQFLRVRLQARSA